ncbi:MAG: DUF2267 domain-containing protein [Rhodobiaceae bacterium]|nr:DUF2267 domain-containing protein [Rhodobiaceae bacterium]
MNELISRIASSAGIDEELAQKAVGIILNFLNKEGPDGPMQKILDAIPGARDMVAEAGQESSSGGLLGGLLGGMGAMGAMNELNSAGLGMGQIQSVTKELVGFAKEKAGPDTVDEVISSIPGLSQFV